MRMLARSIALTFVAPLLFAPAFAAEKKTEAAGEAMKPVMHAHVACKSMGMSDTGMMVEFHNMGKEEIPAGTTVHWMMRGMAQGDMKFTDAVAPGGKASQNYMMHEDAAHMAGDATKAAGEAEKKSAGMTHMAAHAPCSVEAMK